MSETANDFDHRIDTKIDDIGERVARLEGKLSEAEKGGHKNRLSEYGGLIALVLSILTGGFTLYDKFVTGPRKDALQAAIDLRADMNQLASINANIAGLAWSTNPSAATAQAQSWTPQKLALLEKVKTSDKVSPGVLKFADRLALANNFGTFARWSEALDQIELAHKIAANPMERGNAYWAHARLSGYTNKLTVMRGLFAKALDEFKSGGMKTAVGDVMQLYTQWIGIELVNGTCSDAKQAFTLMVEDMASPDIWPSTRVRFTQEFNAMLAQAPKTCDLELPK